LILEKALGSDHVDVAFSLSNLGTVLIDLVRKGRREARKWSGLSGFVWERMRKEGKDEKRGKGEERVYFVVC